MNPTIEELIPLSQRVKEETLEVMKRSDLIRILEKNWFRKYYRKLFAGYHDRS